VRRGAYVSGVRVADESAPAAFAGQIDRSAVEPLPSHDMTRPVDAGPVARDFERALKRRAVRKDLTIDDV
jgi:hypothetical protein